MRWKGDLHRSLVDVREQPGELPSAFRGRFHVTEYLKVQEVLLALLLFRKNQPRPPGHLPKGDLELLSHRYFSLSVEIWRDR